MNKHLSKLRIAGIFVLIGLLSIPILKANDNSLSSDYIVEFGAADPTLYAESYLDDAANVPTKRADSPLEGANYEQDLHEIQASDLHIGQVVPFEIKIEAKDNASCGCIDVTAAWKTRTTHYSKFGFDAKKGVIAAFVDTKDPSAHYDDNAYVHDYSWQVMGTQIQGKFKVCGLEANETVVMEVWMALNDELPTYSSGDLQAFLIAAQASGDCYNEYIYSEKRSVLIKNIKHIQKPDLTNCTINLACPPTQTLTCDEYNDYDPWTDKPITAASGSCGSPFNIVLYYKDNITQQDGCEKLITRTWYATNPSKLAADASCEQSIIVEDTNVPSTITVSCPSDIVRTAIPGSDYSYVRYSSPTANTSCHSDKLTIERIEGKASGSNFTVGTHEIKYKITDACGQSATCSFTITIKSYETPTDPCDNISIIGGEHNITIAGLVAAKNTVQIFNDRWQTVYDCHADCEATEVVTLPKGTYKVYVKYYTNDWKFICSKHDKITVTDATCQDDDNDGVCNDDDICPGHDDNKDTDGDGTPDGCEVATCEISVKASNIKCDDNGTPNNTKDDTYGFDITISGGSGYGYVLNGQRYFKQNFKTITIHKDGIPISSGSMKIEVADYNDDACTDRIFVTPPASCSNGGGTTPVEGDCDKIALNTNGKQLTIDGLDAAIKTVHVFNASWKTVYKCDYGCKTTETMDLPKGKYYVYVKFYTSKWQLICKTNKTITITDGDSGCADDDNDGVCNDKDICPGFDDNIDTDGDGTPDGCEVSDVCEIHVMAGNIKCSNNGTPYNTKDDTYTFDLTIKGGTGWGYVLNGKKVFKQYFQQITIPQGPFLISEGVKTFKIADYDNPHCTDQVIVTPPTTCSNGGYTNGGTVDNNDDYDCEEITVTTKNKIITVKNLDAPFVSVHLFNNQWAKLDHCDYCPSTKEFTVSRTGTYNVLVKFYDKQWKKVCQRTIAVKVTSNADESGVTARSNPATTSSEQAVSPSIDFNLYPNPTSQQTILQLTQAIITDATVTIANYSGQTVYQQQFATLQTGQTLDTSNLPSGLYVVEIQTATTRLHQLLIVNQ